MRTALLASLLAVVSTACGPGTMDPPDMDAYLERLAALTANPGLRRETGQALRRRFDERYDLEASGPALVAACRQAADLARARLKASY